jgi:hypothetical protein
MQLADFKAQIEAARTVEIPIDDVAGDLKFTVKLPDDHALYVNFETYRDVLGRPQSMKASRAIADEAVTGWHGVTTRHIVPDAELAPLEYCVEARTLLFDFRPGIVRQLADDITERVAQRREKREAARKN